MNKPTLAIHKFSSCDGCQLVFLNAGPDLLLINDLFEIVHFAEAGIMASEEFEPQVDFAVVEGSVSTHEEEERIARIRKHSRYLIAMGACACSGGVQSLRNLYDDGRWMEQIYASPETIDSLGSASPLSDYVTVDLELWGCPASGEQVLGALRSLLSGVEPRQDQDKVCMACKRHQATCVMITRGTPCMGPVTRTGCGAICPRYGRGCYGCFGPARDSNDTAFGNRLEGLGLLPDQIADRYHMINSGAAASEAIGMHWRQVHTHMGKKSS